MADPINDFEFYNPSVFGLLKLWLQSLPAVWQAGSAELGSSLFSGLAEDAGAVEHRSMLLTGLKKIKTEKALEHAFRQSDSLDQFTRQVHTWFDAFRTLKLIHELRDSCLPSINYQTLEDDSLFQVLLAQDSDLMTYHERMRRHPVLAAMSKEHHGVISPARVN